MNYHIVEYHTRELAKLIVKSYQCKDITRDQANEQLSKLEALAYDSFPHLEPDGDITYSIATLAGEMR